jgi:hypothetical protein
MSKLQNCKTANSKLPSSKGEKKSPPPTTDGSTDNLVTFSQTIGRTEK